MSFLPIVMRELSVTSRKPHTYWTRFWAAALISATVFFMIFANRGPIAQLGRMMFSILSVIIFIYCLLAGVRSTADCLSEEKREGTLGLLFLTDLRGYDVVAGKLFATSLHAVYGLMAVLPLLGIALLVGGLTGTEFWHMTLVLLNTIFFSLSIGIFVSALGYLERRVTLMSFFWIIFFTLGLPLLWRGATLINNSRWWDILFLLPSPCYAFKLSASAGLRTIGIEFWFSMLTIFGLALVCIVGSAYFLPLRFQGSDLATPSDAAQDGAQRMSLRRRFLQTRWRAHLLECNPCSWLLGRDRSVRDNLNAVALFIGAFSLWVSYALENKTRTGMPVAIFGSFGLHLLVKALVSVEATKRLNEDKRTGALELLLITPLHPRDLLKAQAQRLVSLFALPVLALVFLNLIWITGNTREDEMRQVVTCATWVLFFDCYALSWVSMWGALRGQRFSRAVFSSFGRVMLPPWIILFGFITCTMNVGVPSSTVRNFFIVWFLFSALYDLILAASAKRKLREQFRVAAANDLPENAAALTDSPHCGEARFKARASAVT
jgi:ABC-type transport system involved in cytochrome c biogenesis permease component